MAHNAAWSDYAAGFRETVFVCPEVTYGLIVHPAATDAIDFITASFEFKQERVNRADKTSTRSYRERISHRKETSWSLNLYALPSGAAGTAPDIDPALVAAFGTKIVFGTVQTHASTPCTTTVINGVAGQVATALWAEGGAVQFVNADGDSEVSFITNIATDAVTVSPPFSAAPGTGVSIYGSVSYFLADTLSSLCFTRVLDNIVDVWPGCFVNDVAFDFPGTGEGTLTIGGSGKTSYLSGVSAVGTGGIDDSAITLPVTAGTAYRFAANTRLQCADEVVLVNSVNVGADTLSVTRAQAGTLAAAHIEGVALGPYQPSRTVAGSPVSSCLGDFFIVVSGATRANCTIKTQQVNVTMNNQGSLRNNQYGTCEALGFKVMRRDVTFNTTLWLEPAQAAFYNKSKAFVSQEVAHQHGKVKGAIIAWRMPYAEFNITKVDGGGDDDVSLPFSGIGLGSATGNDELVVAFC